MRRALAVAVAVGMALTLSSGVASGHRFAKKANLSLNRVPGGSAEEGERIIVIGEISPRACRKGQVVTLYQRDPGPDSIADTDRSDKEGDLKFRFRAEQDGRLYAKFPGSIEGGYGHNHKCRRDKSNSVPLNVEG